MEDKAKIVLEKILNCQMSKLGQSREPYYESIYVGDRTVLQIKGGEYFRQCVLTTFVAQK